MLICNAPMLRSKYDTSQRHMVLKLMRRYGKEQYPLAEKSESYQLTRELPFHAIRPTSRTAPHQLDAKIVGEEEILTAKLEHFNFFKVPMLKNILLSYLCFHFIPLLLLEGLSLSLCCPALNADVGTPLVFADGTGFIYHSFMQTLPLVSHRHCSGFLVPDISPPVFWSDSELEAL